jgi:putative ABC transport system ATP-binding protein
MSIIEITGLKKTYGKKEAAFQALKGVNLNIEQGESIAIIGKSGSGKSTLMHLIALLDAPTEGTIKINGTDAHTLKSKDLNKLRNQTFGFIFQQFFMNGNDSVLNNVTLPLKIGMVPIKQRHIMAHEALEAVHLNEKAKNKAINLSGGQKQRVCIARAIVNNPSIIFADEPTGNLDSETSEIIENLLFGLHKDKGNTLIVVTHDPDLAKKCDRQVLVKDGLIVKEFSAANPATEIELSGHYLTDEQLAEYRANPATFVLAKPVPNSSAPAATKPVAEIVTPATKVEPVAEVATEPVDAEPVAPVATMPTVDEVTQLAPAVAVPAAEPAPVATVPVETVAAPVEPVATVPVAEPVPVATVPTPVEPVATVPAETVPAAEPVVPVETVPAETAPVEEDPFQF